MCSRKKNYDPVILKVITLIELLVNVHIFLITKRNMLFKYNLDMCNIISTKISRV